ncbi:anthrone oxygenase family protein [Nocardia gipuzkoensis]
MSVNGLVMQSLMGLTILSTAVLAIRSTGRSRLLAGGAGILAVAAFLITRMGNVPINQKIKVWAVSGPPADYAEILSRWEAFHFARTACALMAFLLVALTHKGTHYAFCAPVCRKVFAEDHAVPL